MMSDFAEVLKNENVSGYITELTVHNVTESEKYQTYYSAECDITVIDNNKKHEYITNRT